MAAAPELVQSGEGGIIHYRNHWPQDPHLRYWTGLVFAGRGELARSVREFQAASDLGLDGASALSLIHISDPTRPYYISYAVSSLKKKKHTNKKHNTAHLKKYITN